MASNEGKSHFPYTPTSSGPVRTPRTAIVGAIESVYGCLSVHEWLLWPGPLPAYTGAVSMREGRGGGASEPLAGYD